MSTAHGLRCTSCGKEYSDPQGEWRLACDGEASGEHGPALLRSTYSAGAAESICRALSAEPTQKLSAFLPWIPSRHGADCEPFAASTGAPAVFRSVGLGKHLGLDKLYVSFSGYFPEKGASLRSASFKELEATAIADRLAGLPSDKTVVVSSAGNTARAFAQVFSRRRMGDAGARRVVVVVPQDNIGALWSPDPFSDCVTLVSVEGGDYWDAIRLGDAIAKLPGFVPEGGARNAARRDGMATSLVAAAAAIAAETPDSVMVPPQHYFQAVGSGTGVIAACEASDRIREEASRKGVFASPTKLHMSQNEPFTPMTEAWRHRTRELPDYTKDEAKSHELIRQVSAFVLTNRRPPYGIGGGVFDSMSACTGEAYTVSNARAAEAAELFEKLEGIDIDPAAAVAVSSLIDAVALKKVGRSETVVLNVTGGGQKRLFADRGEGNIHRLVPKFTVKASDINEETVRKLFTATQ